MNAMITRHLYSCCHGIAALALLVGLAMIPLRAAEREAVQAASSAAGSPLTVMSFNIRYGTADDGEDHWEKRRAQLIGLLREQQADVIGVQEALYFQLQEILKELPEYQMVGIGRSDGKTAGEYSAMLYKAGRLTVKKSDTFWFSDTPEQIASKTWGNTIERICTWARFEDRQGGSSAGTFYVFNLHLDHRSQPSREKSVALLRQRIAAREQPREPVIVTGDFNAGEANPAVVTMRGDGPTRFVDTFRALHADATEVGTFSGFKMGNTKGEKIDYVFVEPSTKVLTAEILRASHDGRYPSDHFPVIARLQLGR